MTIVLMISIKQGDPQINTQFQPKEIKAALTSAVQLKLDAAHAQNAVALITGPRAGFFTKLYESFLSPSPTEQLPYGAYIEIVAKKDFTVKTFCIYYALNASDHPGEYIGNYCPSWGPYRTIRFTLYTDTGALRLVDPTGKYTDQELDYPLDLAGTVEYYPKDYDYTVITNTILPYLGSARIAYYGAENVQDINVRLKDLFDQTGN